MAKQDDFVRITLRIPAPLYSRVRDTAATKSINAEILDRLERSFAATILDEETVCRIAERVAALLRPTR